MTYAIVKYRIMDITVAMQKGLTYLMLLIVCLAPSYVILLMTQEAYFGTVSHSFSILLVLLIALLLIGTGRLKAETQNAIARTLFRRRYDMSETLSKFSKAMVTILDLKTLTEEIVRTLVTGMNIKSVTLYLVDKEKAIYFPAAAYGAGSGEKIYSRLNATDDLVDFLAKCQAPIVVEELKHLSKNDAIRTVAHRLQ